MIKYFDESELAKTKKQRKKMLAVFFTVFAFYFLSVVAFIVYDILLPYGVSATKYKIIEYSVTVLFVAFCFVFLGIPYKRVNRYYKFTLNLTGGIKENNKATFVEYDSTLHDKDGVDCKSLVFLEWNKYKKDFYERKVLVFYEKDFPEIPENAEVKFVTQGNFLIEYEITNINE